MAEDKGTKEVTLKRELGVLSSFSIGYADVGADIYVALGLVIFFAMGAAPLALAIAGIAYIFTALSYTELASAIPIAGGASIYTRESFGDFWGFVAGWGLLLDYTIDIALFGWFTMGYLGGFAHNLSNLGYSWLDKLAYLNPSYAPGNSYHYQALGTLIFILLLLGLNLLGIKESSRFNVTMSVIDICAQIMIICFGFIIAWKASTLISNISQLGKAITWGDFGWGITVAMVSYIGLESISQAAEETANPGKVLPKSTIWLIVAVFTLTVLLSVVSVGIASNEPVIGDSKVTYHDFSPHYIANEYRDDPVAGLALGVATISGSRILITFLPLLAGFMAFTMLAISTNTGVIGASRVTYSMGRLRIMPHWFGKVHAKFRVPHRTIIVFTLASIGFVFFVWYCGTFKILEDEPPVIILADLYNYGALVAFMLVNLSMIKLRNKRAKLYRPWRAPGAIKFTWGKKKYEIPIMAALGFGICFTVWLLVLSLHQIGRVVGTIWFIAGIWGYIAFRFGRKMDLNRPVEPLVTHPKVAHKLHPKREDVRKDYIRIATKDKLKAKKEDEKHV